MSKLAFGDEVRVFGFVMLNKLDDGYIYRVRQVKQVHGKDVYVFVKKRGRLLICHYADSVDAWIQDNNLNLNRIEKVQT